MENETSKATTACKESQSTSAMQTQSARISLACNGTPARIVMLDDEPFVRDATKMMLEFYFKDYEVTECGTGDEALTELSQSEADLLITDFNHPGLTLEELLRILSGTASNLRVLIASARLECLPEVERRILQIQNLRITILRKSFHPRDLKDAVLNCFSISETENSQTCSTEKYVINHCAACGGSYEFLVQEIGREWKCPHCGREVILHAEETPPDRVELTGIIGGNGTRENPFIVGPTSYLLSTFVQINAVNSIYGPGAYRSDGVRRYFASPKRTTGNKDLCEYVIKTGENPVSVWFDLSEVTNLESTNPSPSWKSLKSKILGVKGRLT